MKSQPLQQLFPAGPAASTQSDVGKEGGLEMGRLIAALRRRSLLIIGVTTAVAVAAGIRAYLSPATYKSQFEILIQPSSAEIEAIAAIDQTPDVENDRSLTLQDQLKILLSPDVLKPVVQGIQAEQPGICGLSTTLTSEGEKACYNKIKSRLNVELAGKNGRIFTATYMGDSQAEVELVANLLSKTFLDYGLSSRKRDIQQGLDFLDTKLPDVRSQVNQLQSELESLRQQNDLITPEAEGGQLSDQINQFSNEYLSVRINLEEAISQFEDLQRQQQGQPQDLVASPILSSNSRYQALVQDLLRLDSQIAEASTLFQDNSPDMEALKEQRQNLLNLLDREGLQAQRELISRIQALETRESALADTLNNLDVNVDDLASVTRQFTDLQLELNIATENLNRLLERRESLQIEAAQRELPWELVTPPSLSADQASLPNNVALGLALGLLLSVGLALAIDSAKNTLYTPADLKRLTPLPILGLIPYADLPEPVEAQQELAVPQALIVGGLPERPVGLSNGAAPIKGRQAFQEAFRSLMANIRQISSETPIRSIVISSAEPQEGKSTVAAYLAQTAAAMGERVLLIDADLRLPFLHEIFGLPNTVGLANLLTQEFEVHDLIQRSTSEPNLFLLTTGTAFADPSRLLSARAIQQLMNQVRKNYDLIIFDSPPVLEFADAALISAETDGMMLVSNLGKLKSAQLEQALEKLWISKISLLGIVAREASPEAIFQI